MLYINFKLWFQCFLYTQGSSEKRMGQSIQTRQGKYSLFRAFNSIMSLLPVYHYSHQNQFTHFFSKIILNDSHFKNINEPY